MPSVEDEIGAGEKQPGKIRERRRKREREKKLDREERVIGGRRL